MTAFKLHPSQFFSLLRISLGLWLFFHFLFLLPEVVEIYSLAGVKVVGASPYLSEEMNFLRSPQMIWNICLVAIISSLFFIFKFFRRVQAGVLFIIWIFYFHQNYLTYTPLHPFIGWILLALTCVDSDEVLFPWSKPVNEFHYPPLLFTGFWVISALAYSSSGIQKFLYSPLWNSGTALDYIMNYPAARSLNINQIYFRLPIFLKYFANYFVIFIEGFCFLALFHRNLRKMFWIGILAMHFMIFITLDFTELSLGMLIIHLFLVDKDWNWNFGLEKLKWNNHE